MPDHDDKPDTKLEPPGGAPDQLIDPDVEPVEPTPEARRMVERLKEIKRTPLPANMLIQCCRALKDVLQEYTDDRLLVLNVPSFGDEGPRLSAGSLRQLVELLGPRYRVVETNQPDGILVPDMTPEQAAELAQKLSKWAEEPGRLEVITPTAGGPPLGRPPPPDSVTGAPMTAMEVRETIEYLRQAKVDEDGELCRARMSWTSVLGRAANARRVLLWLLDGPGQLPVAEPCEHTAATVDAEAVGSGTWCATCGALYLDGEWRLPGHPAPAT
jgi:hypothetical protein